MSEATSRDADPDNADRKYGYFAEPWTDFATRAKNKAIDEFKLAYGDDAPLDEIIWQVSRVDLP